MSQVLPERACRSNAPTFAHSDCKYAQATTRFAAWFNLNGVQDLHDVEPGHMAVSHTPLDLRDRARSTDGLYVRPRRRGDAPPNHAPVFLTLRRTPLQRDQRPESFGLLKSYRHHWGCISKNMLTDRMAVPSYFFNPSKSLLSPVIR